MYDEREIVYVIDYNHVDSQFYLNQIPYEGVSYGEDYIFTRGRSAYLKRKCNFFEIKEDVDLFKIKSISFDKFDKFL